MKKIVSIILVLMMIFALAACGKDDSVISDDQLFEDLTAGGYGTTLTPGYNLTQAKVESTLRDGKTAEVVAVVSGESEDGTVGVELRINAAYKKDGFKWVITRCSADESADASYASLSMPEIDMEAIENEMKEKYGWGDNISTSISSSVYEKSTGVINMDACTTELYAFASDYYFTSIEMHFDKGTGLWSDPAYTFKSEERAWTVKAYYSKGMNSTEELLLSDEFINGELPSGYVGGTLEIVEETPAEKFFGESLGVAEITDALEKGYELKFEGLDYGEFEYCAAGTDAKGEAIFFGKDHLANFKEGCHKIDDEAKTVVITLSELILISYVY